MTFAKGLTDCEAERNIILQGFKDMLRILKEAKNTAETRAKAALYDIVCDKNISEEEQRAQTGPFNDLLSQQEEIDIRIRRTILIGLFAFWELSLKNICAYYQLNVAHTRETKSVNDYINTIFNNKHTKARSVFSYSLKEFRNYMTHGSANNNRRAIIDKLMLSNPEFNISKIQSDYFINSYEGLENILKTITEELRIAEDTAKIKK